MRSKIITCFLFVLVAQNARGQHGVSMPTDTPKVLNQIENFKTMNRQQVITNYLQAVASNVTSNTKGVQLKATLFALTPKDSAAKYRDDYYLKHNFARNTQLMLGGGVDKSNNFNALNLGFTYDVLNARDASAISTYDNFTRLNPNISGIETQINAATKTELDTYQQNKKAEIIKNLLRQAQIALNANSIQDLKDGIVNPTAPQGQQSAMSADNTLAPFFTAFLNDVNNNFGKPIANLNATDKHSPLNRLAEAISTLYWGIPMTNAVSDYVTSVYKNGTEPKAQTTVNVFEFNSVIKELNTTIATNATALHGKSMVEVYTYLATEYKKASNEIAERPMVAVGVNYMYSSTGINHQIVPNFQFLKGLGNTYASHSLELSIIGADTIATDTSKKPKTVQRNIGTLQIGLNKVLFTDKSSVSLLEANLALEGDHVFLDKYDNESPYKAFLNLTLQGRPSAKSPWFKLLIKYNRKANFLGFLNVTLNLDNSSNKGS